MKLNVGETLVTGAMPLHIVNSELDPPDKNKNTLYTKLKRRFKHHNNTTKGALNVIKGDVLASGKSVVRVYTPW